MKVSLCFLILQLGFLYALGKPAQSSGDPTVQMNFLGSVDGKNYFADRTSLRSWSQAKEFCRSVAMKLASITTRAQVDLLRNAYNSSTFSENHWTGAREARKHRQFSWDATDAEISSELIVPLTETNNLNRYFICVELEPTSVFSLIFTIQTCTTQRYTLCEQTST